MSDYDLLLSEMREYVPFLEKMIEKLENAGDRSKDTQLQKMKSLRQIIRDPGKKLKIDTLEKCEDVLKKLYEKVEGTSLKAAKKPPKRTVAVADTPKSPSPPPPTRTPRSPSPPPRQQQMQHQHQQMQQRQKPQQQSRRGGNEGGGSISSYLESVMDEQKIDGNQEQQQQGGGGGPERWDRQQPPPQNNRRESGDLWSRQRPNQPESNDWGRGRGGNTGLLPQPRNPQPLMGQDPSWRQPGFGGGPRFGGGGPPQRFPRGGGGNQGGRFPGPGGLGSGGGPRFQPRFNQQQGPRFNNDFGGGSSNFRDGPDERFINPEGRGRPSFQDDRFGGPQHVRFEGPFHAHGPEGRGMDGTIGMDGPRVTDGPRAMDGSRVIDGSRGLDSRRGMDHPRDMDSLRRMDGTSDMFPPGRRFRDGSDQFRGGPDRSFRGGPPGNDFRGADHFDDAPFGGPQGPFPSDQQFQNGPDADHFERSRLLDRFDPESPARQRFLQQERLREEDQRMRFRSSPDERFDDRGGSGQFVGGGEMLNRESDFRNPDRPRFGADTDLNSPGLSDRGGLDQQDAGRQSRFDQKFHPGQSSSFGIRDSSRSPEQEPRNRPQDQSSSRSPGPDSDFKKQPPPTKVKLLPSTAMESPMSPPSVVLDTPMSPLAIDTPQSPPAAETPQSPPASPTPEKDVERLRLSSSDKSDGFQPKVIPLERKPPPPTTTTTLLQSTCFSAAKSSPPKSIPLLPLPIPTAPPVVESNLFGDALRNSEHNRYQAAKHQRRPDPRRRNIEPKSLTESPTISEAAATRSPSASSSMPMPVPSPSSSQAALLKSNIDMMPTPLSGGESPRDRVTQRHQPPPAKSSVLPSPIPAAGPMPPNSANPGPGLLPTPPPFRPVVRPHAPPTQLRHQLQQHMHHRPVRPAGPPQQVPQQRPQFLGGGGFGGRVNQHGRPLTYGEYRKMRLEQEAAMRKWQEENTRQMQPYSQRAEVESATKEKDEPQNKDKDKVEETKESEKTTDKSEAAGGSGISKFKIPKKKRPSVEVAKAAESDVIKKAVKKDNVTAPVRQPLSRRTSRQESDTDSESEQLKIVETSEGEQSVSSDRDATEDEREPVKKKELEKKDKVSKEENESTREMLKTIVASLNEADAAKLLRRANLLEQDGKLSLKQLKYLLAYDDTDSEEEEEKQKEDVKVAKKEEKNSESAPSTSTNQKGRGKGKATKANAAKSPNATATVQPATSPKTPKKPPTPGTRRSSRNRAEPKSEPKDDVAVAPGEDDDDDDDDDDDQLVIDEGGEGEEHVMDEVEDASPVKPDENSVSAVKKRGRGRPKKVAVQDDSVSSSTQEAVKNDVVDEIFKEEKEKEVEEKEATTPSPKTLKSKTWFPGSRMNKAATKARVRGRASNSLMSAQTEVKSEPKEADPNVFLGSDTIILEKNFELKVAVVKPEIKAGIITRLSSITNIMMKLEEASKRDESAVEEPLPKKEKGSAKEMGDKFGNLGPMIVTQKPSEYLSKMADIIAKLKDECERVPEEEEEIKARAERDGVDFLKVIKVLKEEDELEQEDEEEVQPVLNIDPGMQDRLANGCSAAQLSAKDDDIIHQQFSGCKARHLFKCFAAKCAFTSDAAADFLSHLAASHGQQKLIDRFGWLRCCYCSGKLPNPAQLVSHIVHAHGEAAFQCPFCFFRAGSQVSMLVHQQNVHSGSKPGFYTCKHISMSEDQQLVKIPAAFCSQCGFKSESLRSLCDHLKSHADSVSSVKTITDLVCFCCGSSFKSLADLVLHSTMQHPSKPVAPAVRHIDHRREFDLESLSDDSPESEMEEEDEEEDKANKENKGRNQNQGDNSGDGLVGPTLYRCGNNECAFSAQFVSDFRDHVAICEFSANQVYLVCFHCSKQLKHVPTLLEHLKTHGVRRYACSLCPYKAAVPLNVKNHLRQSHKVPNTKLVPVDPLRNNQDVDQFLMMPKNALPKGIRITAGSSSTKDTFAPDEINSIPRTSMFRLLVRCSVCDFVTKVRFNLVKHLRLHQKCEAKNKSSDDADIVPPPITPINPPTDHTVRPITKTGQLLDVDLEATLFRRPFTEEEMQQLPQPVPENLRFACCDLTCSYVTIDEVMLLYHIEALHPSLESFKCKNCPPQVEAISFEDIEFHMRCHGDLLFKCAFCTYYHWQKRTAEKHVLEEHPGRKQMVRDVRKDVEAQRSHAQAAATAGGMKKKLPQQTEQDATPLPPYLPYKCGLCDSAVETLDAIKSHIGSVHEILRQFKCSMCEFSSDAKTELETHFKEAHPKATFCMIRSFFVDPYNPDMGNEERREPLWRRNMPGLRHIRGILYDEKDAYTYEAQMAKTTSAVPATTITPVVVDYVPTVVKAASSGKAVDEVDYFPMKCRNCGITKKTVKGIKMHIKLLHLRTGKFRCTQCQFSANILNSIHTHYKIKHPESADNPDFEERADEANVFSHEYWKDNWDIPTLVERKAIVAAREGTSLATTSGKKRKASAAASYDSDLEPKTKKGKKRGLKRKQPPIEDSNPLGGIQIACVTTIAPAPVASSSSVLHPVTAAQEKKALEQIMERSPFEATPTYKCTYCPKRSQSVERIERHVAQDHPDKSEDGSVVYKHITRDHVVDLLTLNQGSTAADYKCFYCEDIIGSIEDLKSHFDDSHASETFKVKSFQGKGVRGYLECQICGHLTAGYQRSNQKVHFHEEHPLETAVNASKYVSKSKSTPIASGSGGQDKLDLSRFIGMAMYCPKEGCFFEARSLSAINNHLRRHTQTFKCGHCGKTHKDSSDFHRHSAMMHGDKIPDLVKDPEAEAEYEALKGLFDASLLEREREQKADREKKMAEIQMNKRAKLAAKTRAGPSKNTARKSTGARLAAAAGGPKTKMNVARKSTGGAAAIAEYSFYGVHPDPLNMNQISTRIKMGGMEITLNATKVAEMVNLDPKVLVEDCRGLNL
jgi:hypothetical protein